MGLLERARAAFRRDIPVYCQRCYTELTPSDTPIVVTMILEELETGRVYCRPAQPGAEPCGELEYSELAQATPNNSRMLGVGRYVMTWSQVQDELAPRNPNGVIDGYDDLHLGKLVETFAIKLD